MSRFPNYDMAHKPKLFFGACPRQAFSTWSISPPAHSFPSFPSYLLSGSGRPLYPQFFAAGAACRPRSFLRSLLPYGSPNAAKTYGMPLPSLTYDTGFRNSHSFRSRHLNCLSHLIELLITSDCIPRGVGDKPQSLLKYVYFWFYAPTKDT